MSDQSILWRRLDGPGHEFLRLSSEEDGWRLSGAAVFSHEQQPCRLD
ncbi:MAG TPA: putative glycolipid-binding domain-containing protein, partial [Blastocatellia bacterium]|nr:putative glycolipid-binding domain-containing protein [Blastocatellia bacterium]